MSKHIDLTALRAAAETGEAYIFGWDISDYAPTSAVLLALIDTAEAAIAFDRSAWTHTDPPLKRRLRKSLARYTTE